MFPLTHIVLAKQVLAKENPQTVLGSVFPDFAVFLKVGRNMAHEMGPDFFDFCCRYYPNHLDFALGILTHGTNLPGLDYYADEAYDGKDVGYCFQRAEKIAEKVREVCRLPENMALWKAHNFIEMSFEVLTAEKYPDIETRALASFPGKEESFCANVLSEYLDRPPADVFRMFQVVPEHFCFDGTDIPCMAKKYLDQLRRRHGIEADDVKGAAAIIEEGCDLVRLEYDSFMEFCQENVKKSLIPYLEQL